jgi:hypothetical protein
MIINKVLETTIDLLDPNDIYASNIDNLLMKKLDIRYKNKCYQSILILEIMKIIRRSTIKMVDNRLDGGAYIDVQFEVKGIIFIQGEILHGCKIIEIHSNATIAEHEYAGIKLQKEINLKLQKDIGDAIFKILQVGQKIPVIVQKIRYMPNQSSISMIAIPYLPTISTEVYYEINQGLNPSQTEQIGYILDCIKTEEELHKTVNTKAYDFFKDILYPYKTNQKYEQSKKVSSLKLIPVSLELKNMLEIDHGIITYPSEDNKINKRLFWSKNLDVDILKDQLVITSSVYPVLADICNKYLLYLQALRGFVETYPTTENMQELLVYWKLCKNAQI